MKGGGGGGGEKILSNTRFIQKNIVVVIIFLFMVFMVSGCSAPNNNTPVEGAKIFIKAMVNSDAELMEYINHSGIFFPPQYCLEIATKNNWAQYELSQFKYKELENGKVEVTFPDGRILTLEMVKENGKWYFSKM
jgi:hypothetical protein